MPSNERSNEISATRKSGLRVHEQGPLRITPHDKYAPSCLLLGFTDEGRPLHLQVSYLNSEFVKIITLYEPDPAEWYDYVKRR